MSRWLARAYNLAIALLLMPSVALATGSLVIPQTIAALAAGNQPASLLDANWTAIQTYVNAREITLDVIANRPAAGTKGRWYGATDQNGGTLYVDTGSTWSQVANAVAGQLAQQRTGLTLTMAKHTITIGVGAASSDDAVIGNRVLMGNAAALTKNTTAVWVVGNNNGCLDAGSILASTWYHVYLIQRTDTGVVDVLCSTNATTPSLPTGYTKQRRLTSYLTDTTTAINPTTQRGLNFKWATVPTVNSFTNPGGSQGSVTGKTPLGVVVEAQLNVTMNNQTTANLALYILSGSEKDVAGNNSNSPLAQVVGQSNSATSFAAAPVSVWTNTLSQFFFRMSASGAADTINFATLGWTESQ